MILTRTRLRRRLRGRRGPGATKDKDRLWSRQTDDGQRRTCRLPVVRRGTQRQRKGARRLGGRQHLGLTWVEFERRSLSNSSRLRLALLVLVLLVQGLVDRQHGDVREDRAGRKILEAFGLVVAPDGMENVHPIIRKDEAAGGVLSRDAYGYGAFSRGYHPGQQPAVYRA